MQIDLSISPISETTPVKLSKPAVENVQPKAFIANKKSSSSLEKTDNEKLQELQKSLADQNIALRFSRDPDTKTLVVEMVNDKTGEAILQLPSKVSLKLAAEHARLQGLFVNQKI